MASEYNEPTEALASVEIESPSSARREVAAIFQTAAGADAALFVTCGIGEDGRYYTSIEAVGADAIRESVDRHADCAPQEELGVEPETPPPESMGTFRATRIAPSSESPRKGLLSEVWRIEGIRHEASTLLYDGSKFLGALSVLRTDERPFDMEKLEELNGLIDAAVEVLSRAEIRERELLRDRAAMFLLQPDSLEIACSTEAASKWLDEERERELEESVDPSAGGDSFPTALDVDGFRVRLNQMTGSVGARLVANVEYPQKPELSIGAVLTPRQREVVEYAAAGATNREIAETLGISSDTVSDHLSESYQRLGVANRVELARKVAEGS